MKITGWRISSFVLSVLLTLNTSASVTRYVNLANPSPAAPYTSWPTAATNIQDAVDVAAPGDTILVTNGVYQTGARVLQGQSLANRVAVTNAVTVESVNGPDFTTILGQQAPGTTNGPGAMRCVYLANQASLVGFTLASGATLGSYPDAAGGGILSFGAVLVANCKITGNSAATWGGGIYIGNAMAVVSNCVFNANSANYGGGIAAYNGGSATAINCTFVGNSAVTFGGGAYMCNLTNCALAANQATTGGGIFGCVAGNCTLVGNSAFSSGGGAWGTILGNCLVYFNSAPDGNYDQGCLLNYCCTTPLPAPWLGANNITADPQLASLSHLSASSPCRGAGSPALAEGVDIDGETWLNPPAIGCDEYHAGAVTGNLSVAHNASYTNVAVGFAVDLVPTVGGRTTGSRWDFGDGTVVSNQPLASHFWTATGNFATVFTAYNESYPAGISSTTVVHVVTQPVHYVALSSVSPAPPYLSWATAATNIQDAADAASLPGALVLVSNGVYQSGTRVAISLITNRVAVTKPLVVRSVNGPSMTTIVGYRVPGTTYDDTSIRCVFLSDGATLSGFTLTNGATRYSGDEFHDLYGGGVWCASHSSVVSNCVFQGNGSADGGAGVCQGTILNCLFTGNDSTPYGYGGAVVFAALDRCVLTDNTASGGGAVSRSTLTNSLLASNSCSDYGGAAERSRMVNCTVVANTADIDGGGGWQTFFDNCIIYSNNGGQYDPNYDNVLGVLNNCCTTPLPQTGAGNFTNAPLFVNPAGDFHLQTNSPCINAGNNAAVGGNTDLDGAPRISGGTVDVGAYEFQFPRSPDFIAWLQRYGLPTNGSADFADPDHDGMNNWQEWRAGTDPTNANSVLKVLGAVPSLAGTNVTVSWSSVSNRSYYLERATVLGIGNTTPFSILQSNISGLPGTTSWTDTNAPRPGPAFYRVAVQ
jgi:hypothetical protein